MIAGSSVPGVPSNVRELVEAVKALAGSTGRTVFAVNDFGGSVLIRTKGEAMVRLSGDSGAILVDELEERAGGVRYVAARAHVNSLDVETLTRIVCLILWPGAKW